MEELLKIAIKNDNYDNYHKLGGYLHKYYPSLSSPNDKISWKKNWLINNLYLSELSDLSPQFKNENISIILLKGIYLIQSLYKDAGSRFLSDIDILVDTHDLDKVEKILLQNNFSKIKTQAWFADEFKSLYTKNKGDLEITLEVHTRLFWNAERKLKTQSINDSDYLALTNEENFIHLCGHYAFAHTFTKLYWLIDLFEYYKKYGETLDWNYIKEYSKIDSKFISIRQCLYILFKHSSHEFSDRLIDTFGLNDKSIWSKLLSKELLTSDQHTGTSFLILKQLSKDKLKDAIKYNLGWVYNGVKNKFSSK